MTGVEASGRPAPARWARRAALAVVAGAIGLGAVLGARFGTDPTLVRSPLIGRPAPSPTLPYLDKSGGLSLSTLRGQVVVVNFWASWCLPCRQDHADLVAAAAAYRNAGVRFVGVVHQDDPGQARRFLDELGRGYDTVTDPGSRAAVDFGVFGVPETFLIDRRGVILAKISGPSSFPLLADMLTQILTGKTPGVRQTGRVQTVPDQ